MNLSGKSGATLTFWYQNYYDGSTRRDELEVYYRVDGGTWTQLFSSNGKHTSWTEASVTLPAAAMKNSVEIGFYADMNRGDGVFLDDVELIVDNFGHDLTYTASGDVLTAVCSKYTCGLEDHTVTLTLNAPKKTVYGDGKSAEATLSNLGLFNLHTEQSLTASGIEYYSGSTKLNAAPTAVGNYTASYTATIDGTSYTITKNYSIEKADPTATPPSLTVYYGRTLADVTLPDGWTWDDDTLSVGSLGTHPFAATYNPDPINYNNVSANLTVKVIPRDQQFVSIDDQIALTLLIDLQARGKTVNDVTITLGGETYTAQGTLVTEGQYASLYKYTVVMAPSEIATDIAVTIAGDAAPLETSVAQYCEDAPEKLPAAQYQDVLDLTAAILAYSQAAQDVLSESGAVTPGFTVSTEKISTYTGSKFADNTDYVYNASFMALTKPEFRFYVTGISEAEAYAYNEESGVSAAYVSKDIKETLNARFVKTVKDGETLILIEVTGVSAENMGETITVTINGMPDGHNTIVFNGYAFAKALYLYEDATDTRQAAQNNFGAALYNYGYAAKQCFAPA